MWSSVWVRQYPAPGMDELVALWTKKSAEERRAIVTVFQPELVGLMDHILRGLWTAEIQSRNFGAKGPVHPFDRAQLPLLSSMQFDDVLHGGQSSHRCVKWPREFYEDPSLIPNALTRCAAHAGTGGRRPAPKALPPDQWLGLLQPPATTWAGFERQLALIVEQLLLCALGSGDRGRGAAGTVREGGVAATAGNEEEEEEEEGGAVAGADEVAAISPAPGTARAAKRQRQRERRRLGRAIAHAGGDPMTLTPGACASPVAVPPARVDANSRSATSAGVLQATVLPRLSTDLHAQAAHSASGGAVSAGDAWLAPEVSTSSGPDSARRRGGIGNRDVSNSGSTRAAAESAPVVWSGVDGIVGSVAVTPLPAGVVEGEATAAVETAFADKAPERMGKPAAAAEDGGAADEAAADGDANSGQQSLPAGFAAARAMGQGRPMGGVPIGLHGRALDGPMFGGRGRALAPPPGLQGLQLQRNMRQPGGLSRMWLPAGPSIAEDEEDGNALDLDTWGPLGLDFDDSNYAIAPTPSYWPSDAGSEASFDMTQALAPAAEQWPQPPLDLLSVPAGPALMPSPIPTPAFPIFGAGAFADPGDLLGVMPQMSEGPGGTAANMPASAGVAERSYGEYTPGAIPIYVTLPLAMANCCPHCGHYFALPSSHPEAPGGVVDANQESEVAAPSKL